MWTRNLVMSATLVLVPGIAAAKMICRPDWRGLLGAGAGSGPADGGLVSHFGSRKGAF